MLTSLATSGEPASLSELADVDSALADWCTSVAVSGPDP